MTKPIPTDTSGHVDNSVRGNLGISISKAESWLTSADAAAIVTAERLAVLIDTIFDTGEDLDKLASLIAKFESLLRQLKLTPVSRDLSKTASEVDNGEKYAESYLRVVDSTNRKPKTQRSKSRPAS